MEEEQSAAPAAESDSIVPMPPADSVEPDAAQRRRQEVDAMVQRCLDPAMGLCLRALDPDGLDPTGHDEARSLVMRALADCAKKRISADDDSVRDVMRHVSELTMDALVGNPGSARVPTGVDLGNLVSPGTDASDLAPSGRLDFAVLQDAVAASRAMDRQVAFVVLAAAVPPADACTLLGLDSEDLDSSMHRIGRRISEGHSGNRGTREVA